jgi:hypothetical protein
LESTKDHPTLIATFPDFQKNFHHFDRFHFIGCCVDEDIRKRSVHGQLKDTMDLFAPRNPMQLINNHLPSDYETQVSFQTKQKNISSFSLFLFYSLK